MTGPNGDLHFSKKDFYWLPHWRAFWVGTYGIPEIGAYRFTVTREGFLTIDEVVEVGSARIDIRAPFQRDFVLTPGAPGSA